MLTFIHTTIEKGLDNTIRYISFRLFISILTFFYMTTPSQAQKNDTYSDEALKKILSKEVYNIVRLKGTEAPYSGKYLHHKEQGTYYCVVCKHPLFNSEAKFDSHCGWPSFFEPAQKNAITYTKDTSYSMIRTEITCSYCHSHLGHVFDDGPPPTHKRYCLNSLALVFKKK